MVLIALAVLSLAACVMAFCLNFNFGMLTAIELFLIYIVCLAIVWNIT